jgi:hypothetical protein
MHEPTMRSFYPPSLFQQDKALLFWTEHHLPNPAADRDHPLHEGVATKAAIHLDGVQASDGFALLLHALEHDFAAVTLSRAGGCHKDPQD